MSPRKRKRKPPLEEAERIWIKKFYEAAGCIVVNYSQAQKAQQTAGIPDLQVFVPRLGVWWYHEVKRQQGEEFYALQHGQSEGQVWFEKLCDEFRIEYLLGARDVAIEKLVDLGLVVSS